jgi:uncharacterized protein with PQ loop repeat
MHLHLGLRHKRERLEGRRPAPHTRYIKALDRVTFVAGVVGPFTVLPQIYEIFTTHQAAGVSVTAWVLMFIVTFPWIFYGVAHRDRAIIWSFILWEVANAAVIVGAVMYR